MTTNRAADPEKLEGSPDTGARKKALSPEEQKESLARGRAAVRAMSTSPSSAKVTDDEIDAEIAAARKARHRR